MTDLDPRNVDLARDRVGPMLLDEHTLADLTTDVTGPNGDGVGGGR